MIPFEHENKELILNRIEHLKKIKRDFIEKFKKDLFTQRAFMNYEMQSTGWLGFALLYGSVKGQEGEKYITEGIEGEKTGKIALPYL